MHKTRGLEKKQMSKNWLPAVFSRLEATSFVTIAASVLCAERGNIEPQARHYTEYTEQAERVCH